MGDREPPEEGPGWRNLEQFYTATSCNWNEAFQTLAERETVNPEEARERATALSNISDAFIIQTTQTANKIIEEYTLPLEEKTIVPLSIEGNGGDATFTGFIHSYTLFRVVSSSGNSQAASRTYHKGMGHALKATQAVLGAHVDGLHVPLTCVIDYLGHRVECRSILPLSKDTIFYRQTSGDTISVFRSDVQLEGMIRKVLAILNLKKELSEYDLNTWHPETLFGEYVFEAHRGKDNRYYLTTEATILPSPQDKKLYQLLRPELLKHHASKSSSENRAVTQLDQSSEDSIKSAHAEQEDAARYLFDTVIPRFAIALDTRYATLPLDRFQLTEELHFEGINVRHMGILRSRILLPKLRECLLTEMAARTCACELQERLRKLPRDVKELVCEYFNLLMGTNSESEVYWRETLQSHILEKFPGAIEPHEKGDLRPRIDGKKLFERIAERIGVVFVQDTLANLWIPSRLSTNNAVLWGGAMGYGGGSTAFKLQSKDIGSMIPRTKSVRMPTFVETLLMVERGPVDEFLYTRELDIREAQHGRESIEFARASLRLAELYARSNCFKRSTKKERVRYKFAKRLFEHAISVIRHLRGADHQNLAIAEVHFAHFYTQGQRYQKVVPLLLHAMGIFEHYAQTCPLDLAVCLEKLSLVKKIKGLYFEARDLAERALELYMQQLGPDDIEIKMGKNTGAALFFGQEKFEESKNHLREALYLAEKSGRQCDVAQYSYELANFLVKLDKDTATAEPLYKRAIEEFSKLHAKRNLILCMHKLGNLYMETNRYDEAEALYRKLLDEKYSGWEALLETPEPTGLAMLGGDTIPIIEQLAWLKFKSRDFMEADKIYKLSVNISEIHLWKETPQLRNCLVLLADIYMLLGKFDSCDRVSQWTLELAMSSPRCTDIVNALNTLGALNYARGNYPLSLVFQEASLTTAAKGLGPHDQSTAHSLHALGLLCYRLGKFGEADRLFELALDIRRPSAAPRHVLAQSYHDRAYLLATLAKYSEAETYYKLAHNELEQVFGPDHPSVATVLNNQAWVCYKQARLPDAKSMYERARRVREIVLGDSHPDTARSYHELAELYHKLGKYVEAEKFNKQALLIRETVLGSSHVDVARSLQALAVLNFSKGLYTESQGLQMKALSILEISLGESHPKTAEAYHFLGKISAKTGSYQLAEEYYNRALSIREHAFGPQHPDCAASLVALGYLSSTLGKYDVAAEYYTRALATTRKTFDDSHPDVADATSGLAWILFKQAKYQEAERLYNLALRSYETSLGVESPEVALACHALAELYQKLAKYPQAETCNKRALSIRTTVFGTSHVSVARSLYATAALSLAQGRYLDAQNLVLGALYIYENTLGPFHNKVAMTLSLLGTIFMKQGRYEDGEGYLMRAHDAAVKSLGDKHPDTAYILYDLGYLAATRAKYEEAENFYINSLSIIEGVLGSEHPTVVHIRSSIAWIFYKQAKYYQAERLYLESLAVREKVLGREHHETARSYHELAELYIKLEHYKEAFVYNKKALDIRKHLFGQSPEVGSSIAQLALLHEATQNYEVSEDLHKQSLKILEDVLGPKHTKVAQCLHQFGKLYLLQGKYDLAEGLFKRSLSIREQAFTANHPDCAQDYLHLGKIYAKTGQHEKAIYYFERATTILIDRLGPTHPDVQVVVTQYQGCVDELKGAGAKTEATRRSGGLRESLKYPLVMLGCIGASLLLSKIR